MQFLNSRIPRLFTFMKMNKVDCSCCLQSFDPDLLGRCPSLHPVCVSCLVQHGTTRLNANQSVNCVVCRVHMGAVLGMLDVLFYRNDMTCDLELCARFFRDLRRFLQTPEGQRYLAHDTSVFNSDILAEAAAPQTEQQKKKEAFDCGDSSSDEDDSVDDWEGLDDADIVFDVSARPSASAPVPLPLPAILGPAPVHQHAQPVQPDMSHPRYIVSRGRVWRR